MNPVLVEVYRGETLESFHRGVVCIVDEEGNTIAGLGDISQICYPRSTMKLFQHIPLLMSGAVKKYDLSHEDIAIMCGSHNGEEIHQQKALSILAKAGLNEAALQCGPQLPELNKDKFELYSQGKKPKAIHNNCSGKHAGFLLYCHYMGYDLTTYLNPEHPLQQEIKLICSKMYECKIEDMRMGIDGCSAPIYTVPVYNQALAYKNLVSNNAQLGDYQEALNIIVQACTENPYMLAGKSRYCTDLLKLAGDRVIGKTGADGIYCLGLRGRKWGIAVKIDDGKMGPQYHVVQSILKQLGVLTDKECEQLSQYSLLETFNFSKRKTGYIKTSRILNEFKFSE